MKVKMKVNEKHEDCCKDNSQKKKYGAFQNYATPNKVRRLECMKNDLPNNVKNILFSFFVTNRRDRNLVKSTFSEGISHREDSSFRRDIDLFFFFHSTIEQRRE